MPVADRHFAELWITTANQIRTDRIDGMDFTKQTLSLRQRLLDQFRKMSVGLSQFF